MKKSSLIVAMIFLLATGTSFQRVNAQDKSKEEKEKELQIQEAIDNQKKAMADQKKAQEELQKVLEDQKIEIDEAMKNYRFRWDDSSEYNKAFRIYEDFGRNRSYFNGEPFVITPGIDVFNHSMPFGMGDSERTSWDFSKSFKETTFSRDYTFDVESTVNTVVMSVNGDCKSGEIHIRIIMPNGKTYSDIIIDEFGNLNWRKSFVISETENKDKAGAWKYEISSSKATGFFKISLQTY
jgi:type II secretory pathway pseudopilin PulG